MRKRLPLMLCVALVLVPGAQGQVVVCPRGNPDECYAPDDPRAQLQGQPDPALIQAPESTSGQAWLEWRSAPRETDPLIKAPGACAFTPGRARDRFQTAMEVNDLNALVATYQWRGKDETSAEPLIERLSLLPLDGHWESSFVSESLGDDSSKAPTYWRWSGNNSQQAFAMRKIDNCWFVEFTSPAPESVYLTGGIPRQPSPSEAQNPADLPDELIF